jgi:hypothetical protein
MPRNERAEFCRASAVTKDVTALQVSEQNERSTRREEHNCQLERAALYPAILAIAVIAAGPLRAAEPTATLQPKQLKTLIAKAKSPAEHSKIAQHYTALAESMRRSPPTAARPRE